MNCRTLESTPVGTILPKTRSGNLSRALDEAAESGVEFRPVAGVDEASQLYRDDELCALFVDLDHPDFASLDDLQETLARVPDIPVVVTLDEERPWAGLDTIRRGVEEYIARENLSGQILVHALGCSIERKRLERRVRQSEAEHHRAETWFRNIFEHAADAIFLHEIDGRFLDVNPAAERSLGYSREELLEMRVSDVVTSRAAQRLPDYRQMLERGESVTVEGIHERKDGTRFPVEVRIAQVEADGRPAMLAIARDVSDRVAALEALRESEERFRSAFEQAAVGMCHVSPTGEFLRVNERLCGLLGYAAPELLEMTFDEITHPEGRPAATEAARRLFSGEISTYQTEKRYLHREGHSVWARLTASVVRARADEPGYVLAVIEDITAERLEASARRVAEERLRSVIGTAGSAILVLSPEARILEFNETAERIFGVRKTEVLGESYLELFLEPGDVRAVQVDMAKVLEGEPTRNFVNPIVREDGTRRVLSWNIDRMVDRSGEVTGVVAVGHDITEQQQLEEQFRQAQKMEAVGNLAGGIAHDFNNLLTAISGFTRMALDTLPESHPAHEDMEEVERCAARAAELTEQLLAFSRKQRTSPEILDLRDVVRGMRRMLSRLLGADVDLRVELGAEPAPALADEAQLEQVLLNLGMNARDAMPTGGALEVRVSTRTLAAATPLSHGEAPPGRYSTLVVADTGHGMSAETIRRVFEPFFTTKEVGRGTGLGLSTAWGIVAQAGGYVDVSSEPGRGTTFRILLPYASGEAVESPAEEPGGPTGGVPGTVLLVEDEGSVRRLAAKALRGAGYEVHEAVDAEEALDLVERYPDLMDLVVTDVVMPGMSGARMAEELRRIYPDMPVLFVSGYTEERLPDLDRTGSGTRLLQKPFSMQSLLRAVHDLLTSHE